MGDFLVKLIILLTFLISSCAGPMSPFGALNVLDSEKTSGQKEMYLLKNSRSHNFGAAIYLTPDKMSFHDKEDFQITIKDPSGIGPRSIVELYWNGRNVSYLLESVFDKKTSADHITFDLKDLRLLPTRNNEIYVTYRRSAVAPILMKKYLPPVCPWRKKISIKTLADFKRNSSIIKLIEYLSLNNDVNPSFIAGLIAQESSFNPLAVSLAKAIGLTQITSLAQTHVLKDHPDWPSYQGVSELSYLEIKALILVGEINHSNEWRLNKHLSILGGIKYLEFVEKYWSGRTHSKILTKAFTQEKLELSDVMLASYNSGPYRVKRSMLRNGEGWLDGRDLKEAKKYVNRVKSYCYHFSNKREINL
jgi:hypothetical protein